ncbi:MAG: hypothetical protein PHW91_12865 [Bacteroidales bacterium]|nr:hypothetical protein [Bacteroidales bacterium]
MKSQKLYTPLLTLLLAFCLSGCEKNKNDIPVDFTFQLLDTLGNESITFNEGENIIFSFLVTNKSSKVQMVENFFPIDEFFNVYKSNQEEINFGKPYDGNCEIGYFSIPANCSLEFKCPWVVSSDPDHYGFCLAQNQDHLDCLPIGSYFTVFSSSFNVDGSQTEVKQFKIEFTVK